MHPKPTRLGRGLLEFVLSDGSRTFRMDYWLEGKQHRRTLAAKTVTDARKERRDFLSALDKGDVVAPTKLRYRCPYPQVPMYARGRSSPHTMEYSALLAMPIRV
jgi:hypothetical protein